MMQQLLARTSTPRGLFALRAPPHQRPAFRSAHRVLRPAVVLPPVCSLHSDRELPPAAPSLVDQKPDQKETGWAVASKKLAKTAAICGLAVALALGTVAPAEAARSGGRAGGSSFSSRSSRSYSSGTSRSMGGGGGGGYRSYSAPSVTVMPSVVMPLAPVGYGYGYGYSFFPAPSALFSLFALAIFAFVAVNTFTSISGGSSAAAMDDAYGPEPITVAKVQVGLLGLARTLKDDLDSLAVRADTSGSRGLHMLLQETVLALLRNPDYYVYGGVAADEMRDGDKAERAFNRLSMQERSKFREETFSNVGGVTRRRKLSKKEDGVNELMVVTIVVAAEGRLDLPKINNSRDLRAALNALGGISPTKVVAVELLWTPQAEGDYYTRDEVIADYPDLVPL